MIWGWKTESDLGYQVPSEAKMMILTAAGTLTTQETNPLKYVSCSLVFALRFYIFWKQPSRKYSSSMEPNSFVFAAKRSTNQLSYAVGLRVEVEK